MEKIVNEEKDQQEKNDLYLSFIGFIENSSLSNLKKILKLNKRKVKKYFKFELNEENVYGFLNISDSIKEKLLKEKKEEDEKLKWESDLLHSSELFGMLNIKKSEFDKWRKDGRIKISEYQVFEKWGRVLETTLHHPEDIKYITQELIKSWREDDIKKTKNKMSIASLNSQGKRELTLNINKTIKKLGKDGILIKENTISKIVNIPYVINDIKYLNDLSVVFNYRVNVKKINELIKLEKEIRGCIENIDIKKIQDSLQSKLDQSLDVIFNKESKDYKEFSLEEKMLIIEQLNNYLSGGQDVAQITVKSLIRLINISINRINQIKQKKIVMETLKLKNYEEGFPMAREMGRHFNIYLGPTNSGKTYEAIESLKKANSGVYLAPLRLLAMEIYDKLNRDGIPCNLHTGEEFINIPGAKHTASTIEMLNFNNIVDVAVIDEVQMLEDRDRGWAWTAALIGVPAKSIYCVGSKDIGLKLTNILNYLNESYIVSELERKCPLNVYHRTVDISDIEQGDVIIAFSRKNVLHYADKLEKAGHSTSVIYGALSPEVRREQAERFLNGKTKCMVATDAIGMGLNIPAKRIIFSELNKFDGQNVRRLTNSEIKQIAGRAGRYGLHSEGVVSVFHGNSLSFIKSALVGENKDIIGKVNIAPSMWHIEKLSKVLNTTKISNILTYFSSQIPIDNLLFKTANLKQIIEVSSVVDYMGEKLSLEDKFNFSCVPFAPEDEIELNFFKKLMNAKLMNNKMVFRNIPNYISNNVLSNDLLIMAEKYNKLLTMYAWLKNKYPLIYVEENLVVKRNSVSQYITNLLIHQFSSKEKK